MKTIIVEDELKNREILEALLANYFPEIIVSGNAISVNKAIETINTIKPDLVFFDIEIQDGTAFDVLEKLTYKDFGCIFITAYNNYAIKAFKYNAIDYLLKPINIDDLGNAIKKVSISLQKNLFISQINNLLATLRNEQVKIIAITSFESIEFININEIIALEAKGSYTNIILQNNKQIVSTKIMKEYENTLPESHFCRVHNSYIINVNFIKKYVKGRGGFIVLENGLKIEVSTRKKSDFLSRFE